ncbi:hypothetical protein QAD02_021796 [Eretmocerus hayati]|uniref:Uncharacterized protein n=1 Tax=Eretmocerus hayati TaxID=131215 RepID=A0ACC2PR76_9HYME|nr:hypothetical protein QAD02_021796 [Eretmocerus hayati]
MIEEVGITSNQFWGKYCFDDEDTRDKADEMQRGEAVGGDATVTDDSQSNNFVTFEEVVRNYDNLPNSPNLPEDDKRDAMYDAVMTNIPAIQQVEFLRRIQTEQEGGVSYQEIVNFIQQSERNGAMAGTASAPPNQNNTGAMTARYQFKHHTQENRCYHCDSRGHRIQNCLYEGRNVKLCFNCEKMIDRDLELYHISKYSPLKEIKPNRGVQGTGVSGSTPRYYVNSNSSRGSRCGNNNRGDTRQRSQNVSNFRSGFGKWGRIGQNQIAGRRSG